MVGDGTLQEPPREGVDHTIEIAGGTTIIKAIVSTKSYGSVWVVGYLDDAKPPSSSEQTGLPDVAKAVLYTQAQVQGVVCGSYKLFSSTLMLMSRQNSGQGRRGQGQRAQAARAGRAGVLVRSGKEGVPGSGSGKFVGKIIIDVASA